MKYILPKNRFYGELEICHLGPDSFSGKKEGGDKFEAFTFDGKWRRGVNSGGCGNDGFCKIILFKVFCGKRTKICF